MDFLHEDPKAEREYIKRLMKHRHQQSIPFSIKLIIKNRNKTVEPDRALQAETKHIQASA